MKWPQPLQEGIFLKRYKRFFADVEIGGQTVVAHVANTGSLKSALEAGRKCMVSPAKDPKRKLKYSLEMVQAPSGVWVGVNTSWPNILVKEAFAQGIFSEWSAFDQIQAEVKISPESRLDFCLSTSRTGKKRYVEVKNVTLSLDGVAAFPDAKSERGQKHLRELMRLLQEGHEVEILFTIQRADCDRFTSADDIDPEYGRLLREAKKMGVVVSPYLVEISPHEIVLTSRKLQVVDYFAS